MVERAGGAGGIESFFGRNGIKARSLTDRLPGHQSVIRKLSWVFFALACIGVPVYANWALDRDAEAQRAAHVAACGLVAMGIIFFSALMVAFLSALAGVFGFIAFRSLKKPRPKRRLLELVVLIVPALVSAAFVALFYLVP